jgi:hypothetical protein
MRSKLKDVVVNGKALIVDGGLTKERSADLYGPTKQ